MRLQQGSRNRSASDLAALGAAAASSGHFGRARKSFIAAISADASNAQYRFNLAIILETLGDPGGAAEQLTRALAIDPNMAAAARRLSWIVSNGRLPRAARLDPAGLMAALAHDRADRDLVAAAILHHVTRSAPLRQVLELGNERGWQEAAAEICLGKARAVLGDALFLEALRRGVVSDPAMEKLLTAVRRALLLDLPQIALDDDAPLARFAVALVQQCWLHEFVWAETPEESEALASQSIATQDLTRGDRVASRAFLLRCMYRRPSEVIGRDPDPELLAGIAPPAFREALAGRVAERRDIRQRAAAVEQLGTIVDTTSRKVANQYETSPYPRWTSVLTFRQGDYLKKLATVFNSGELDFLNAPFEVLIAGCGTGRQAVSAAFDYGPNARIVGLDVTAASLGYASMMAERMGATNLAFARGDIQQVDTFEPSFLGRFKVIECTGVLHHMARPFDGWRALQRCLAPGGIMLIGLYSALARRGLATLKADAAYPGPDCDDAALRAYRQHLQGLPADAPGSELRTSVDFYSASGFRDYILHVSEQCTTLPEIADFMREAGLTFHGFFDVPLDALRQSYPDEVWPGSLARWAECEAARPSLFGSMYQFWCR